MKQTLKWKGFISKHSVSIHPNEPVTVSIEILFTGIPILNGKKVKVKNLGKVIDFLSDDQKEPITIRIKK